MTEKMLTGMYSIDSKKQTRPFVFETVNSVLVLIKAHQERFQWCLKTIAFKMAQTLMNPLYTGNF